MFDHTRIGEFIEQVALIPALYKNADYGVEKAQFVEIWKHLAHTFDISESEAEQEWNFLVQLHRLMHPTLPESAFSIPSTSPTKTSPDPWNEAETTLAKTLSPFFQENLDKILLIETKQHYN